MEEFVFLKQVGEFLDAHLEIPNYAAQGLSFDGNATMHRDHNSCVVSRMHVDRVTIPLSSKLITQSLRDSGYVFARHGRQLGTHAGISIGLMRIFSTGTGRPSSMRLSM